MEPTIKPNLQTTVHRDNTVSFWNVFERQWRRISIFAIVEKHDVFASLSREDRNKINSAIRRSRSRV